ncbi:MAG: Cell division and transport-associated protein TolA [Rhodocyclaceae bacterium]|nr:Cell division and transport-associated protein TolA [Rhodocyclaceae bacterium]
MIPTIPQEPGKRKALALAAAVHLALIGALLYGVHWKSSQPEAVEVELWSSRPAPAPAAAPPAPRPEPKPEPRPEPKPEPKPEVKPPVKPDIALKEEKKKPEPKKPEPKPEPKKPEPKPEPKKPEPKPEPRDAFKDALEREEKQRSTANTQARLAAQAAAEADGLRAAAAKRGLADYISKIRGKIRGNIVLPMGIQGNPEASFEVNQLPSGEVLSVKLKKSSGNPALDTAIERAILKSSPLPKPDDPSAFDRILNIKYRPFEE